MDLLPVIFEMIKKGVRVDIERANRLKKLLKIQKKRFLMKY